jgi:hypothetical protein
MSRHNLSLAFSTTERASILETAQHRQHFLVAFKLPPNKYRPVFHVAQFLFAPKKGEREEETEKEKVFR